MRIDRQRAEDAFRAYVSRYNDQDEKVCLKIEHTFRVAGLCDHLASCCGLEGEERDSIWLSGLLHDVGRFEQLKRYGTFIDADSIDHAALGAEILFGEGQIRKYAEDESEDGLLRTAVFYHSAYRLPEGLDDRTLHCCNILRDADKIDILKVNVDFSPEDIYNVTSEELRACAVTEAVLEDLYAGRAVLRSKKRTAVDHLVGHISLIFELVYPESLRVVARQGYLEKLMQFPSDNPVTREQFAGIRTYVEEYLDKKAGL